MVESACAKGEKVKVRPEGTGITEVQGRIACLLGVLCALCGSGCGAQYVWVEEEVAPPFDHTSIKKIAVVEFENRTRDRSAGRIVAARLEELLVTESGYEVVTRMDLKRLLHEHNLSVRGALDPEAMKRLGKVAGVDALVVGSVETYEIEETVIKPLKVARRASILLLLKAVNTTTGRVVCSKTAEGDFFWRGWTDTDSAVSPRECLGRALDDAMTDARVLFPHKKRVRRKANEL